MLEGLDHIYPEATVLAFQISINGQPLYTVGIGDFGMMHANVEWARIAQNSGKVHEHLWVGSTAMDGAAKSHHHWQNVALKVGDEVTIKVVQVEAADPPLAGMPDFPYSSSPR